MNFIFWILFGLIVGTIANILDPHPSSGGILGSIILGILGAILGGMIGTMVFKVGIIGFDFYSLAIAVLGSLLLLFIGRAVRRT